MENRLITQKEFYALLNEHVFKPNFGEPFNFREAKEIVHGIADIISEITLNGDSVRLGRLGTFQCHITPPGQRWNPTKKKKFRVPKRRKLTFKASKSTRRLFGL